MLKQPDVKFKVACEGQSKVTVTVEAAITSYTVSKRMKRCATSDNVTTSSTTTTTTTTKDSRLFNDSDDDVGNFQGCSRKAKVCLIQKPVSKICRVSRPWKSTVLGTPRPKRHPLHKVLSGGHGVNKADETSTRKATDSPNSYSKNRKVKDGHRRTSASSFLSSLKAADVRQHKKPKTQEVLTPVRVSYPDRVFDATQGSSSAGKRLERPGGKRMNDVEIRPRQYVFSETVSPNPAFLCLYGVVRRHHNTGRNLGDLPYTKH